MRKYNINANLVHTTEQIYKTSSAVLMNSNMKERLRTAFGERRGCLLSPSLFNIFVEHARKVIIVGRSISYLRSANDKDVLAEYERNQNL